MNPKGPWRTGPTAYPSVLPPPQPSPPSRLNGLARGAVVFMVGVVAGSLGMTLTDWLKCWPW